MKSFLRVPTTFVAFCSAVLAVAAAFLSAPAGAQTPAPEVRAIWVSRFEWPSSNQATAKANIDNIMSNLAANNFNTVFFQVRGQCDVHYPSPDEPWTNTYNWTNPGWDPLAYAIQAAHSRGIEFHAYINTHILGATVPASPTVPPHPIHVHGPSAPGEQSWMIRNSGGSAGIEDGYYWISPANTEASAWTRRQILHIVKNYDVDGVHFDRIRSPGSSFTYDAATQRRWNAGQVSDSNPDALGLGDFMRSQITRDLRNIYGEIQYYKPWVKTSAAPFGIVRKDGTTQYQGTGTQSHFDWFQDSWGWLDAHVLDFMVPQIYWEVGSAHPFEKLLADWMARTGGRHVVAGSTTGVGGKSVSALLAEHQQTRLQNAHGHCIFSAGSMGSYWNPFKTSRYDQPTTVPEMPWKTNPTHGTIIGYVVDGAGQPVVDAKINLAGDTRLNAAGTGPYNYLSAHDGFFSILDVVPGASHQVAAVKPGVGQAAEGSLSVTAGGVTSVTLVLRNSQGVITLDRSAYKPGETVQISLRDSDLDGEPSVSVPVESPTEGGSETVLLTPVTGGGVFGGSILLASGAATAGDGVLQVSHGDLIRVSYSDADTGSGAPATPQATATVDAQAPVISGVTVGAPGSLDATVSFATSEPAAGLVRFGTACGNLTRSAPTASSATAHSVTLTSLSPNTTYYFTVEASDLVGNTATADNGGACFTFTTTAATDYLTELFGSDNDLDNKTVLLEPDGSGAYYSACIGTATSFPTDPAGGTPLGMEDETMMPITLGAGRQVRLYGTAYSSFRISSNGFVSFSPSAVQSYAESLSVHFAEPRISMLFVDFNPQVAGTVWYQELANRAVVTFQNVTEWSQTNSSSFQLEMYYDGRIRMTWLSVAANDGLVGLSRGSGIPADFIESNFSAYPSCGSAAPALSLVPPPVSFTLAPEQETTMDLLLQNTALAGGQELNFLASAQSLTGNLRIDPVSGATNPAPIGTGASRYRGNMFEATQSTRLRLIESALTFAGTINLHFVVYESTGGAGGLYHRILSQTVQRTGTSGWVASDPIDVPLTAGRYYIIAAGWGGTSVSYAYDSDPLPRTLSFGRQWAGFGQDVASLGVAITYPGSTNTYRQRLTTHTPWLSAGSAEGSLAAGAGQVFEVRASSRGVGPGTYEGTVRVSSNDPGSPLMVLPATLNVVDDTPSAVGDWQLY